MGVFPVFTLLLKLPSTLAHWTPAFRGMTNYETPSWRRREEEFQ